MHEDKREETISKHTEGYDLINRCILDGNQFYSSILNHLPDTVIKVSPQMIIIWANETVLKVIPDAIGQYCYTAYHNRNTPCENCPSVRCIETGAIESGIMSLPDKITPERMRYTENTGIPIKDDFGNVVAVVIVGKDVTEHREMVARLRELTESMDSERLQSLEDEKKRNQFLHHITSEIKTYVDQMADGIEDLKKKPQDLSTTTAVNHLNTINEKTKRQIENVFELFSIEEKSINLIDAPFDFRELIDDIYNRFRLSFLERNIIIESHLDNRMPKRLIGDVFRLSNIISNLIENAVNHTENGKIRIEVGCALKNDHRVALKIIITDTGMGFTEEQMDLIHCILDNKKEAVFNQAAQVKGMSLITAKRILEVMEGSLSIQSQFGKGTEVAMTLTLPYASESTDHMEVKINAISEQRNKVDVFGKKKILVAEDEVVGRVSIKLMLQNQYEVILAKNGKEAVEAFKKEMPDLVLMDIMMPIMDGFEAFDQIEKINRSKIPIIACTARVIDSEKEYLMSYGFNDYLPKPVDVNSISKILVKYLKQEPLI